jgi:hypothetical protein
MIADLKADTERWEAERRAVASRGRPSNRKPLWNSGNTIRKSDNPAVEYRASKTHQSRQYYGTTPENIIVVHAVQEDNDSVHERSLLPALGDQHQGYDVAERRYRVAAGPIITTEERISAARVPIS